jgi:uracil-DNA glycosylase
MPINRYKSKLIDEYKQSVGITSNYKYLDGNLVNPIVPSETAQNRIMIIGAYPTAKFGDIDGVRDVPVSDIKSPFSNETYFDGSRVRNIISGYELENHYLSPLEIDREQCWITNIVKVFLFKQGHIKKYNQLGNYSNVELHSGFVGLAKQSLPWIAEEIRIAMPKVILILGLQVAAVLFKRADEGAMALLDGNIHNLNLGGSVYKAICFPHPGILIRKHNRNPWPERLQSQILPAAYSGLRSLGF